MTNRDKGSVYGGECNRTACSNPDAFWWNESTRCYYCRSCAERINEVNRVRLCRRAFKVAIVDDDRQLLDLTRRQFEFRGCPAIAIDQPTGATHKTLSFGADVLIVDYNMPLKGTAVVSVAKKHNPKLFVVIQSAADEATLKRVAAESGADLWLSKSEDFDRAMEKIRAAGRLQ